MAEPIHLEDKFMRRLAFVRVSLENVAINGSHQTGLTINGMGFLAKWYAE